MKQKIGIWLDKKQALMVYLENGGQRLETLASGVEFFHPKGGSRSRTRWGPQAVVKEKRYLEREKNQLRDFYMRIKDKIENATRIAIYGPAFTPRNFLEFLQREHPSIASRVDHLGRADSMSENQFAALTKNHFTPATSYKS